MYKRLIEKQAPDLDILYLADSSTCFPLKPGCIDLHLDFFAANEHNFYHDTFLYKELFPYLAPKADLIGTYFYFDYAPRSMKQLLSQYPESYYKNFNLEYFHTSLKEAGYELLEEEDSGCTTDSGAIWDWFPRQRRKNAPSSLSRKKVHLKFYDTRVKRSNPTICKYRGGLYECVARSNP